MAAQALVVLVVDVAIAIIVLECLVVSRRRGRARSDGRASAVANLVAGACLMLALRAALVDARWPWVVGLLTMSGMAHVGDWLLRSRQGADTAP